jgi:hypothetical protein
VTLTMGGTPERPVVERAGLLRTARILMEGMPSCRSSKPQTASWPPKRRERTDSSMTSLQKTGLVITAHPGDFVWRAGGAIALHAKRAMRVKILCLSYGERGESQFAWKKAA